MGHILIPLGWKFTVLVVTGDSHVGNVNKALLDIGWHLVVASYFHGGITIRPQLQTEMTKTERSSGDDADREDLAVKRRRLTGETLLHLSAQINTAAAKGHWYGGTIWSEGTVNKLVDTLIQTLE